MTECTPFTAEFANIKRRKVSADFTGGDISSDAGGALLLRQAEKRLGLVRDVAACFQDDRDKRYVKHSVESMLKQRIFGIAMGYEDLNDHDTLSRDLALQTAAGQLDKLASPSTLGRLERNANTQIAWDIHKVLVENFIASFDAPPEELILDFDATDDPVHGNQDGRFFHGYYDHYCFLPLYVFCGSQLLVAYLRPSNIDGAKHSWPILSLLVKRLRKAWPNVRIVFRGDSGFCRHRMLDWCDRNDVGYIVGVARNKNLEKLSRRWMEQSKRLFESDEEQKSKRVYGEFQYAAQTWSEKKRVIAKAEFSEKGENPRYIVTNLRGGGRHLYESVYCARGDMENRIKEQQLGLFADRTSSQYWWTNQLRLLLSSLAYVLVDFIRRVALKDTVCEKMQVWTLRNRLFKIGAVILRNTRRVRFLLSSAFPLQREFILACERLRC